MSWYDWAILVVAVIYVGDTVRETVAARRQMREWRAKMRELERSQRSARPAPAPPGGQGEPASNPKDPTP